MENKPRRSDKEIIDMAEIHKILENGLFCHIALLEGGKPYIVTMNYGYSENALYLHAAPEGRKMEAIRKHPEVCFQVITGSKLQTGSIACEDWTIKYRSVVGYGQASLIYDPEEKKKALDILMGQYTSRGPFIFPDESLEGTAVIKIHVTSLSGKKSGY